MSEELLSEGSMGSSDLLTAARGGDGNAFRALVDPCRPELEVQCYRMLASVHDAEDAVQEVLLRAWLALPRFESRSSLRSWLYRIAMHVCFDAIARSSKRVSPAEADPTERSAAGGDELMWVGPYPDEIAGLSDGLAGPAARYEQRESVELAFVAALQYLSGKQRAVLILRDVLSFSAREAAAILDITPTAVHSALQHARRRLEDRLPDRSQQLTLRTLGDERLQKIVTGYCRALEHGDGEAIAAMLTEDAVWSMPPTSRRYEGHVAILAFLNAEPFAISWRHVATRASGQMAVGWYRRHENRGDYVAEVFEVLDLRGEQISAVTAYIDRGLFARFGLPASMPGQRGSPGQGGSA